MDSVIHLSNNCGPLCTKTFNRWLLWKQLILFFLESRFFSDFRPGKHRDSRENKSMISTMPIILLARQLQRPNCIPSEARQTTWVYKASVSRGADKGTRARLIRYVHVDQIIPDSHTTISFPCNSLLTFVVKVFLQGARHN